MSRLLRGFIGLIIALSCTPIFSQSDSSAGDKANPLYDPVSVVLRLSYDNFKNIKLMMTAIINFGGGQAEFDRLVDGYAEASSLYFSRDYKRAADAFAKNEKDIREVAIKLAEKYKTDSEAISKEIISHNVKLRIKTSVDGKRTTEGMLTAEKLIGESSSAIEKGNDFLLRTRPVQAVQLYRRAKEQAILYYQALGIKEINGQKISERFERELADNKNKVFVSKEKKN